MTPMALKRIEKLRWCEIVLVIYFFCRKRHTLCADVFNWFVCGFIKRLAVWFIGQAGEV